MAVKEMLKASAGRDLAKTTKSKSKPNTVVTEPPKVDENIKDNSNVEPHKTPTQKEKKSGGRPTNKDKGIKSRKQYTLTLKEDTYKLILEKAGEEDLSFAKFMERAALEYISKHK